MSKYMGFIDIFIYCCIKFSTEIVLSLYTVDFNWYCYRLRFCYQDILSTTYPLLLSCFINAVLDVVFKNCSDGQNDRGGDFCTSRLY